MKRGDTAIVSAKGLVTRRADSRQLRAAGHPRPGRHGIKHRSKSLLDRAVYGERVWQRVGLIWSGRRLVGRSIEQLKAKIEFRQAAKAWDHKARSVVVCIPAERGGRQRQLHSGATIAGGWGNLYALERRQLRRDRLTRSRMLERTRVPGVNCKIGGHERSESQNGSAKRRIC